MSSSPLTPTLTTKRLTLRLPRPEEAASVACFFADNLEHLRPFQPTLPPGYTTAEFWRPALEGAWSSSSDARWFLYPNPGDEVPIGYVSLTSIKRGHHQSAELSYAIDHRRTGEGLMSEAVAAVLSHGASLQLHRIDAKYRADNERSGALLHRFDFTVIGVAPSYAWIDGEWRDHVLTVLILDGARVPHRATWAPESESR
jgi:ribosomal-protein-alanine N-acetyltransferase